MLLMLKYGFFSWFSEYRILGKKGEGTFSEVLKCQSIEDGQYYACKRMKQQFERLVFHSVLGGFC